MWYWIIGFSVVIFFIILFFANAKQLNRDLGYDEYDSEDLTEECSKESEYVLQS